LNDEHHYEKSLGNEALFIGERQKGEQWIAADSLARQ